MDCSRLSRSIAQVLSCIAIAIAWPAIPAAMAGPVTPGNIVMFRAGSGTNALSSTTGNDVFLDERTPAGVLVQSIAITSTGAGTKLISAGGATSEGALSISSDGRWIGFSGYNTSVGTPTASMSSSTSGSIPRTIGILDTTTGNFTLTVAGTWFSAQSPRGVATADGNKFLAVGGSGGLIYGTVDGSSGPVTNANTPMTLTGTNLRVLGIADNKLYVAAATGAWPTVGLLAGNPLVTGSSTGNTLLPSIPAQGSTGSTMSRYGFTFLDTNPAVPGVDTLYAVDDSITSGGLWKYTLDSSGTWNAAGSVTALTGQLRGLAGAVDGSNVKLFMTGSANTLWGFTDTSAATSVLSGTLSAFTSLVTASGSTAFRGVVVVPNLVPEPAALALLGVGVAVLGCTTWTRRTFRRGRST